MSTAVRRQLETGSVCYSLTMTQKEQEETQPLFAGIFASIEGVMQFVREESEGSTTYNSRTFKAINEKSGQFFLFTTPDELLMNSNLLSTEIHEGIQFGSNQCVVESRISDPLFVDIRVEFHFPQSETIKQVRITKRAFII